MDWPLSWAGLVMLFLTTTEAPPVATPEMILMALPLDFCQALMAGFGPTYAASSWLARIAVVSSVPELKICTLRVTFLPRVWVKMPLFTPTRAGAWVMLARKPRRSVTCGSPPEPDEPDEPDELHAAASATAAATPATARILRMYPLFYDRDDGEPMRRYYRDFAGTIPLFQIDVIDFQAGPWPGSPNCR